MNAIMDSEMQAARGQSVKRRILLVGWGLGILAGAIMCGFMLLVWWAGR